MRSAKGCVPSSMRGFLWVNLATLLWSGNIVLGRSLREAIGPWTLAAVRASVAAVPFVLLLHFTPRARLGRREWGLAASMAATGVVGFQVLQYAGLHHTTALNAGLMNATGPLLTLLLAWGVLSTPFGPLQLAGSVASFAGVGLIVSRGAWGPFQPNPGDLLVLAAAGSWALYSLAGRTLLRTVPTAQATALSTLLALPLLWGPAAFECFADPPALQARLATAVLYIGLGPSFVAFLAWNEGVRTLGPNGAMAFYNTLPVYAGLLAAATLGEWPSSREVAGGLLVVAGCVLAARGARRSELGRAERS